MHELTHITVVDRRKPTVVVLLEQMNNLLGQIIKQVLEVESHTSDIPRNIS
jgi:hypothetical protein